MEAYARATGVFTRLHQLNHALSILNWDSMTNLPVKGNDARNASVAELEVIKHELITGDSLKVALEGAASQTAALNDLQRANLREMQREWTSSNKLSADLVKRKAMVTSEAEQAWRKLRGENNWTDFVPHLEKVFDINKEVGAALQQGTTLSLYDALLNEYEPGMRSDEIESIFADVKTWLPALIKEVRASQPAFEAAKGPFAIDAQKELGLEVMRTLKFDFDAGRLDVSAHPFTGGVPEDVRLTTRYSTDNFDEAFLGIVHETGHAMYEQNRPRDVIDQPVSNARSMGVHESQSLFFEMQMSRSKPFQEFLAPLLRKHLGGSCPNAETAFQPEQLFRAATKVEPGLIRVDADELTYPLHVILRFEIEKAIAEGRATVADIPVLWNAKMKEYLDLDTTDNYKDGCMQDIHWPMGAVGYFPTYTLGAMYAAQMMAAVRRDLGDAAVNTALSNGKFEPITSWLRERVWSKGSQLTIPELLMSVTGEPLNVKYFRAHLENRYKHRLS